MLGRGWEVALLCRSPVLFIEGQSVRCDAFPFAILERLPGIIRAAVIRAKMKRLE
jgi:hypothetical protein